MTRKQTHRPLMLLSMCVLCPQIILHTMCVNVKKERRQVSYLKMGNRDGIKSKGTKQCSSAMDDDYVLIARWSPNR